MCTANFPPDVITEGWGSQVNKFEQVSINGHQVSHVWREAWAGTTGTPHVLCLKEGTRAEGGLYSEVECIMGNCHAGPPPPPPS